MGTHFFSVTCIRNMQRIILFSGLFSCLLAFSTSGWINPNAIRDWNLESINEIENHGRLKRSEEDDDSSEESKETKEDEESNEDDDKDFSGDDYDSDEDYDYDADTDSSEDDDDNGSGSSETN